MRLNKVLKLLQKVQLMQLMLLAKRMLQLVMSHCLMLKLKRLLLKNKKIRRKNKIKK
jgi:hypothetical protein